MLTSLNSRERYRVNFETQEGLIPVLNVELKDFFEFAHEAKSPKELKDALRSLLKEADKEKLKLCMAVKLLQAVAR
ncbi:MAG: hypothetical protein HZA05_06260 [Nitrospirae bacterium]|nr:hypothetical protein [Nitrospirota bacterium]